MRQLLYRLLNKKPRGDVSLGRRVFKRTFPFWQMMGFHVTLNHFYEPIPDTRKLGDDLWPKNPSAPGIDMNDDKQLSLLRALGEFKPEIDGFPKDRTSVPYEYYYDNGLFGIYDGGIYYGMIRHHRPKRIIEIGSGFSTYVAAKAISKNREADPDYECHLTCIEPYPNETLRAGFPGISRLVPTPVQHVPLEEFDALEESDILFIDSSHVIKVGSDVQFEFFRIIPRLQKGVLVHVHDIFIPEEYPKSWVKQGYVFWNEQYVLQAFLCFNETFEVLWGGRYSQLHHADAVASLFGRHDRDVAASFWMQRVR